MSRLILLALLTGCAPTIAEIDTSGDPDNEDPGTDDPGTDAPLGSAFAGAWAGPFEVSVNFGGGPQPLCLGEVSGEVDKDGVLSADGLCEVQFGRGGGGSYELAVAGTFDDEGPFLGNVMFTALGDRLPQLHETELSGQSAEGEMDAQGIVVVRIGLEIDAPVSMNLQRQ